MKDDAANPRRYRVLNLHEATAERLYGLKKIGETWDSLVARLIDERAAARRKVARMERAEKGR